MKRWVCSCIHQYEYYRSIIEIAYYYSVHSPQKQEYSSIQTDLFFRIFFIKKTNSRVYFFNYLSITANTVYTQLTYIIANKIIAMPGMSLITADSVARHPSNTSPSRFVNTFSKSKRFLSLKTQCKEAFYANRSQLSKQKVSIGESKRSDFTSSSIVSPASCSYQKPSQFSKLSKTYSFGLGRKQCPQRSYLYKYQKNPVPGPGSYENQLKKRTAFTYSIRPKTVDVVSKHLSFLGAPGPGTYQSLELNPQDGRFKISRFSDTKLSVISKAKRFRKLEGEQPGPSTYLNLDDMSSKGKYVLSQRRGKGTRPFDKEMKFTVSYWKTKDTPGPGAYGKPTDFGVYGDYNYYKSLRITS